MNKKSIVKDNIKRPANVNINELVFAQEKASTSLDPNVSQKPDFKPRKRGEEDLRAIIAEALLMAPQLIILYD